MAGPSFLRLDSARCSVVLETDGAGAPLWRYFGPRLAEGATPPSPLRGERPTPSFTVDLDQPLSVFPTFGVGWFHQSALLAHRAGRSFEQAFTAREVAWLEPGRAVRIRLLDEVAALAVEITLRLLDDVLTLSTRLQNLGEDVLDVQWLAAGVIPLPDDVGVIRSYGGRHASEFQLQVERPGRAIWRRENHRGLTSHDNFPGAVACVEGAGPHAGLCYGVQLAWSGNHVQTIEWIDDGRRQWQAGVWLAPGEVRLAPGEAIATPDTVAACSDAGFNGLAAAFHREARRRLCWPGGAMRPRPVSLNTWEGNYFRHDLEALKAQATLAAELGVERFVLDDGWFHRRDDDTRALGDWRPDARKYPQGLGPLVSHVRGLGLEFGLWVEPEMVSPDSDLYRAHPDWTLRIEGRPLVTGRNQLVLDLSRPEVADHLFGRLDEILSSQSIAYLKWDHNRDLTVAGSAGRAAYRTQVEALYALLDRLRAAHPEVEIESCAGGGGRIDLGVVTRTHRFWTSDCIDARSRVAIQRGFLQFLPPEVMGAHVGASPAHTTGRRQGMDFRAAVALSGHFGIELDLTTLDPGDRDRLARWIGLYKRWRGLMHAGRTWLGEAGDGIVWQAHGDEAGDELLLFVLRLDPQVQRHAPVVRLPMLSDRAQYEITRIDREGGGVVAAGDWLRRSGFAPGAQRAESCRLFHVRRLG